MTGPGAGDLEEGGDRRFQVGNQRRPYDLRFAGRVARGKRLGRRLDLHQFVSGVSGAAVPKACASAARLTVVPSSPSSHAAY